MISTKHSAQMILGLTVGLFLSVFVCRAATPAPDHPLSLKECVRFAIEQNPSAASALHSGRAAMARVGISRSALWPTLGITGALSESYSRPPSGSGSGGNNGLTSSSATFSGQYMLWDSGLRKAGLGGAQASYEATDAGYATTVQDLAVSVDTNYFFLQGAEWILQIAQETLKQADFHLDMAKARNDVGLSPRSDMLKAMTAQADAKLQVIHAESTVTSTRSNLAVLMGFSADTQIQIEDAEREARLPELPDWASGWQRAQATLPELRAATQMAEAYRFAYLGAKALFKPSVTVNGSAGVSGSDEWPDRDQWRIGLNLNIPIFTGYENKYQIIQSREAWESSKADLQNALLNAERAAYEARISLAEALQSVSAAEAFVASAQENMDVAEGQYKNGLGSMLDIVDATTSLESAKLRLISARLSVATTRAAWERATGENLLEDIVVPSTSTQLTVGDK